MYKVQNGAGFFQTVQHDYVRFLPIWLMIYDI